MRRTLSVVGCLLLVILTGIGIWWATGAPAKLTLTREELQREVEKKFPIEKSELLFSAALSKPRVLLNPANNRLGLGVTIMVSAPLIKTMTGQGELDGNVRFDPAARELYLDSPRLKLIEASGISEKDLRSAEEIINPLLATTLARVPIYRLKETDLRVPVTQAQVKDVRVQEGSVVLRFAR